VSEPARTGAPAQPLRLTLVRHGETDGQSSIRYFGRTNVPLSAAGREQMRHVAAALGTRQFAAIYSSTLVRSTEAALIISNGHAPGWTLTQIAGFNEIDFGDWEGLTAEEIEARHPALYARWELRRGDFCYPGGESTSQFRARVLQALHQLLAEACGDDLLFILHKGVIRSIVAELLGDEEIQRQSLSIELGSIHVVTREHGQWKAERLDHTAHLSRISVGESVRAWSVGE